jgi:hypothetical protein
MESFTDEERVVSDGIEKQMHSYVIVEKLTGSSVRVLLYYHSKILTGFLDNVIVTTCYVTYKLSNSFTIASCVEKSKILSIQR